MIEYTYVYTHPTMSTYSDEYGTAEEALLACDKDKSINRKRTWPFQVVRIIPMGDRSIMAWNAYERKAGGEWSTCDGGI